MKKQNVKKIIVGTMVVISLASMAGCKKKAVCDFCDEKKPCTTKEVLGEKVNICDDCMDEITEE